MQLRQHFPQHQYLGLGLVQRHAVVDLAVLPQHRLDAAGAVRKLQSAEGLVPEGVGPANGRDQNRLAAAACTTITATPSER